MRKLEISTIRAGSWWHGGSGLSEERLARSAHKGHATGCPGARQPCRWCFWNSSLKRGKMVPDSEKWGKKVWETALWASSSGKKEGEEVLWVLEQRFHWGDPRCGLWRSVTELVAAPRTNCSLWKAHAGAVLERLQPFSPVERPTWGKSVRRSRVKAWGRRSH